ncbi:MAG: DUF2007 domain-containing protein [Solirubrobacterales bacterium]|nr:DUF2007 domain-containing protein [Solirubrobacterales bacterium]
MSFFKRPENEPVQVAYATNQAEAEMIQGILSGEGIPSMVRRNRGFDVPDFLAAGPRDVVVPPSAAEQARRILESLAPEPAGPEPEGEPRSGRFADPGEPTDPGEAPHFPG